MVLRTEDNEDVKQNDLTQDTIQLADFVNMVMSFQDL